MPIESIYQCQSNQIMQLASRACIATMRGGTEEEEGDPEALALPEDVVLEILARVQGVADLFRCAAACRRWRALVSDRSFLRRRWPPGAHHRSSLVGFFFSQEDPSPATMAAPAAEENFVLAPRSVLRPGCPLLSTFVPGACRAGILGRAVVVPLASHGGLLLLRLVAPRGNAGPEEEEEPAAVALDHLAVCDLHSGACHVLPPLHRGWFFDYFDTSAYAVLPGADCSAASFSFKVLVIGINEDKRQYYLRTCSSSSSSSGWSAPSKLFDPMEHGIFGPIKQRDAVVVALDHRGGRHYTAHWLLWDLAHFHALAVDAATGEVSLHRLPLPPRDLPFHLYDMPRLAATPDGAALSALCLLRSDRRLCLEVWTQRRQGQVDGGGLAWHHDRVVELERPKEKKEMDGALCVCFGEKSGTLLARDRERCLYVADLESGGSVMEEVPMELQVSGGCKTAIAVEIDWPALFACRLGGKPVTCY